MAAELPDPVEEPPSPTTSSAAHPDEDPALATPRASPPGEGDGLVVGELDAAARLRSGARARARPSASVIVVRDGPTEVEVLLVKRNPAARFMGGVWVFPGGAVDIGEGEGDAAHRAAAVRELAEEAGIDGVDPAGLVKFSRWITPAELAVRFDTHFFIAPMPAGQEAEADGEECVAEGWFAAQAALDAHADGRILLVFPTIRQLEQLRGFRCVEALIEHARARAVPTSRPRMVLSGDGPRVVMPDEAG
ncbi:MAG: NUDIX hydrolase [Solirubrobacteraceae bacterium]